jgi:hypothetical protein
MSATSPFMPYKQSLIRLSHVAHAVEAKVF